MSRKQSYWVIALFFIILLLSLVISLPLRHVLEFVELPVQVKIKGLTGNVTGGNVEAVRYQKFTLTDVDFTLQPSCLLKLSICYQLKSEDRDLLLNLETNLLTQNLSVTQSQIQLDSSMLKDVPQMLIQPKGEMLVAIQTLTYAGSNISGLSATIDWPRAGIQGEDQLLGNYHATIVQQDDSLTMKLDDKDSLLSIRGDIDIKWNGQYNVDLKFESKPELNESVISVLQLTTKKSGLNQFSLKKSARLPAKYLQHLEIFMPSS